MIKKAPRGLYLNDWEIGKEYIGISRTITETDVITFNYLSRDVEDGPQYEIIDGKKIVGAHGTLTASIAQGLVTQTGMFEGTEIAHLASTSKWVYPVCVDDTIVPVFKATSKRESKSRPGTGILTVHVDVYNQDETKVMEMDWTVMMAANAQALEDNDLANEHK